MDSDLRHHASALRRGADRLTLLRLRVSHGLGALAGSRPEAEPSGADGPAAGEAVGEDLLEQWSEGAYPALGRAAAMLRGRAGELERHAERIERRSGRRLGGYAGAGFLGRGEEAGHHVRAVARFVGAEQGAGIGGFPLTGGATPAALHVSDDLGQATPDDLENLEN